MKKHVPALGGLATLVAFLLAWQLAAPADAAPVRHSDLGPGSGVHVLQNWAPADTAARSALSVASSDVGKVARQTDTGEYYVLTNHVGPTWAKIPGLNHAAVSVVGRSANSAGAWADIAASADDRVLARTSGTLSFTNISAAMLAANAVTDAKIRQSSGVSLLGRSANSTGDIADITASADGQVLARQGGALAFTAIGSVTGAAALATTSYSGKLLSQGSGGGATSYWHPYGQNGNTPPTALVQAQLLWARAGTIKNLRFINMDPTADADTYSLTLNVNGVDTALTLAGLTPGTSTLQSDTTHSVSVAVGDKVCFKQVSGAGGLDVGSDPAWAFDFVEQFLVAPLLLTMRRRRRSAFGNLLAA